MSCVVHTTRECTRRGFDQWLIPPCRVVPERRGKKKRRRHAEKKIKKKLVPAILLNQQPYTFIFTRWLDLPGWYIELGSRKISPSPLVSSTFRRESFMWNRSKHLTIAAIIYHASKKIDLNEKRQTERERKDITIGWSTFTSNNSWYLVSYSQWALRVRTVERVIGQSNAKHLIVSHVGRRLLSLFADVLLRRAILLVSINWPLPNL